MADTAEKTGDWVHELVRFLRTQPAVSAVRIDPAAQTVAVATLGHVEIAGLEEKLAATVAAIEAELAAKSTASAPAGYSVRREGDAVVVGRDHCVTAEKMWLWREMEWPEIKAEPTPADQEWRLLATLAAVCGAAGLAGWACGHFAPDAPWIARSCFIVALIAGGWDAAIDTWENLRKREIDIHFLMLVVAVGAMIHRRMGRGGVAAVFILRVRRDGGIRPGSHAARGRRAAEVVAQAGHARRGRRPRDRDRRGENPARPARAREARRGLRRRRHSRQRQERERRIRAHRRGRARREAPRRRRVQRHD